MALRLWCQRVPAHRRLSRSCQRCSSDDLRKKLADGHMLTADELANLEASEAETQFVGGMPIAELESVLSTALTACLQVSKHDRTAFVAQHLIKGPDGCALFDKVSRTKRPPRLGEEIAEMSRMLSDAVNAAAQHQDQPLQRISEHLTRQNTRWC